MTRTWWLLPAVACACSDPADGAGEPASAAAWLSVTLSEPDGERTCADARPAPYLVGSEDAPITDVTDTVSCTVHSTDEDTWFQGALTGVTSDGVAVHLVISNEDGQTLAYQSGGTGLLTLDPASAASCVPLFTATLGNAVEAEFGCPLVPNPDDPTEGCGITGTVHFENCAER